MNASTLSCESRVRWKSLIYDRRSSLSLLLYLLLSFQDESTPSESDAKEISFIEGKLVYC